MPQEWQALDGKSYPDYTDDASWGPKMVGQNGTHGFQVQNTPAKLPAWFHNQTIQKEYWQMA